MVFRLSTIRLAGAFGRIPGRDVNAPVVPERVEWIDRPSASAMSGPRTGRIADGIVFDWPDLGRLIASRDGSLRSFVPDPRADVTILRKFAATDLKACLHYLKGNVSLHGAAVQLGSGALALVGESGTGKSTTALALVRSGRASFLADDAVHLDGIEDIPLVEPADDAFWLDAGSSRYFGFASGAQTKTAIEPVSRSTGAVPLRAIVELAFDPLAATASLRRLAGIESFLLLSRIHVCYPHGDLDAAARILHLRAQLADAVPAFQLRRPRSLALLEECVRILQTGVA